MNREDIEEILKNIGSEDVPVEAHKIAEETSESFSKTLTQSRQHILWSNIIKSPITKLAAAAVMIIVALIVIRSFNGTPAWAIDQTVQALEEIRTITISGTDRYGSEYIPFKFWLRLSDQSSGSFDMRYECHKHIVVVRGTRAWAYWHDENVAKLYENVETSSGMMRDLRFWYKIAQLSPWVTGKMLATLKVFADHWQQTYGKHERTGRDCVFVTCSYEPLSISFWFVCDTETKLIVEGKYWRNINSEGPPECHAISFAYNEKLNDETFNFKIPEGAKIVKKKEQREADALFAQGEKLFENKETVRAIKLFQEVYEKYPKLNIAETALMMIGICYDRLEQYEKAIESYEKSLTEYPNLKGWTESTYFYLGRAYMKNGQKDKALEAFQNCLITGEGIRESDKFPLKHAREYIKKLKSQE